MPASVSLSDLCWSTPDDAPLLADLNLTFGPERTGIVGRNGTGKSTLLRLISGDLHPASGLVRVTGSIAMMRQEAMEQPDETIADLFGVRPALDLLDRAEAGHADADGLAEADWTLPARMEGALLRCGLSVGPKTPLATLSGGQRSRAALAALILAEPDFLLLDEPTNNLDRDGRKAVIDLIRGWAGGAIIASHDRELLEEMDAIVELTSLGAARYGGSYSDFRQRKETELDAAARDLAQAERARSDAARRAQQASERKARKDSAGQRARARGDQPKILMDAAKGRAEASGGAGAGTFASIVPLDPSYQAAYETCDDIGLLKPVGPGASRNFAWDHAVDAGAPWHWVMDDNIRFFMRLHHRARIKVSDGAIFRAMEDFADRFDNLAMCGPAYSFFAFENCILPFCANTRIYSCNLIRNDAPFRWRGRYNEDTILSIDMLKAGWSTVQFNAFLQCKAATQTMKGGNTEAFYEKEGTLPKSEMLQAVHPDVASVVRRFKRDHHLVNYKIFNGNALKPNDLFFNAPIGSNEYGMRLVLNGSNEAIEARSIPLR